MFCCLILLSFAGILRNDIQISRSFSSCFNTNAWESESLAKADAVWISKV